MKNIILENEFIALQPIEKHHVEALYAVAQHEEIWTHMSDQLTSLQAVEDYVDNALQERQQGVSYKFVIFHKASNHVIGSTSFLDISAAHKRIEIGSTWLTPSYWRTEVNTMCKYLLLQYCFEQLQLQRVQIKTGHENIRSQRAIERLGASKEGILRNHMRLRDGRIRHTVMYSITNEEWPAIKQKILHLMP